LGGGGLGGGGGGGGLVGGVWGGKDTQEVSFTFGREKSNGQKRLPALLDGGIRQNLEAKFDPGGGRPNQLWRGGGERSLEGR